MSTPASSRPLWTCPDCGRAFANAGQRHACGRHSLEAHFAGREPRIRELYDAFLARIREIGPVTVLPQKTRIAFQTRMSFAQLTPARAWIDGHLVLARRVEHPAFRRIDTISPRNHVHHFRLTDEADISPDLLAFLREAYDVGEQKHLDR
ncbi:MAG TPA: DUF5655 domain-containing protein [Longimicrobium sp.]|jgi:hypothetical protein